MNRIWQFMYDPRVIIAAGLIVVLISAQRVLSPVMFWGIVAILILAAIIWLLVWFFLRRRHARQGDELVELLQNDTSPLKEQTQDNEQIQHIKRQMSESIKLIRKSRIGDQKGHAALYELPWYMMIGNPAAGKSSAIQNSGLRFPFAENNQQRPGVQGVGGTRHCDWFFSTEGILLDTAGRYAVYEEDHKEWLGFLNLLKKSRSKAPINGILIGVSIAELISHNPEHAVSLAKNLRSRVQDLTEQLEVFAPVYVIFTKMDLVAGFTEFFSVYDAEERHQVWGATIPYVDQDNKDASTHFDEQFNLLYDGLKDLSTTHLMRRHSQTISPSVMTFPLEFKSIKPALKLFISTLFEENPFQFQPVFRGFYFTSALQEGVVDSPMTKQIVQKFSLNPFQQNLAETAVDSQYGYFLKNLFSKVILADKHLVRQHHNRNRRQQRHAMFLVALLATGILFGLWTWSYRNNQLLIQSVAADLNKVQRMQVEGQSSLSSQFNALLVLQDRLEQLDRYETERPLSVRFGLYQGEQLRTKLRTEYLNGVKLLMLKPVHDNIARYLGEVNAKSAELKAQMAAAPVEAKTVSDGKPYTDASATSAEDAYNALKAYLMLADHSHMETSHLNDQITRFWRSWLEANRGDMSRGDMIRQAERIISYSLGLAQTKEFPVVESDLALVDQTRETLRQVIKGLPARDRVYTELKMRAAVRYPSVTVAQVVGEANRNLIVGSYALPGAFTKAAWDGYVNKAIDEASKSTVQGKDWVLDSTRQDDLTLTGSPAQIRRELVAMYKKEYIQEWKKFIRAVDYVPAKDFAQQLKVMNSFGDAEQSPVRKLLAMMVEQTSWDNPDAIDESASLAKKGFVEWFKQKILQRNNTPIEVNLDTSSLTKQQAKFGVIGSEFEALYNIARMREDNKKHSLLDSYMDSMAAIRTRLNKVGASGDAGPGVMGLVRQTLQESGSEFNAAQQLVDEQMLAGTNDEMRQLLRPVLIKPLMQAFKVMMPTAQQELNKQWTAQVYQPFSNSLAAKYPFAAGARIEATPQEIGRIFGESGSISQFVTSQLDPLVVRRGMELSSKSWNGIGITLNPKFVADFPQYIAPVGGGVSTANLGNSSASAASNPDQTTFQIYPLPNAGISEYTIDIDGQRLHYTNGVQEWTSFVWPNPSSQPGVRITMVDLNGKQSTLVDEPGAYGLEKLMNTAARKKLPDGTFELRWNSGPAALIIKFRLISGGGSSSNKPTDAPTGANGLKGLQVVPVIAVDPVPVVVNTDATSGTPQIAGQPQPAPAAQGAVATGSTPTMPKVAVAPAQAGLPPTAPVQQGVAH